MTQQSDFYFLLSPLSSFLLLLPHFFSLAGDLVGFILVGKVLGKTFRILGVNERKGYVGSGTRFSLNFLGQCYIFFCLFLLCPRLNWAHSGMV